MEDKFHDAIVDFLKNGKEPDADDDVIRSSLKNFRRDAREFTLKEKRLEKKGKIVIKKSELPQLFEIHHVDTLHNGTTPLSPFFLKLFFSCEGCTKLGKE